MRVTFIQGGMLACCLSLAVGTAGAEQVEPGPLVQLLESELQYTMQELPDAGSEPPYYLAYTITDTSTLSVVGTLGALTRNETERDRSLDVDVRVGSYEIDSTRQLRGRGQGGRGFRPSFGGASRVSLEDDDDAIRHALWRATDRACKQAAERYKRVQTNLKTMVDETHEADDFSREEPQIWYETPVSTSLDRELWVERIRSVSKLALEYPLIQTSNVALAASAENRTMVTSEGTKLQTGRKLLRVVVAASTRAEDGMDLSQSFIFNTASEDGLPEEADMRAAFQRVIDKVLALRDAPLVEPYTGPAILLNRASGVFFHEIFGHRIEGHRQKNVREGQTFTKMIGKPVLPSFLSVADDPTVRDFAGVDLRGFYRFDDEGVPGSRVELVKEGVLQTFLLSRSPVEDFDRSNGHGRREPGRSVVSRQGNLIVSSSRTVTFDELRKQLLEECEKQSKPFGYVFEDITGGFTTTGRGGPQAFKVLPVVVYRVYTDGRPDELVRGVDIVGTPLSCFASIVCTADDSNVFNGSCGAESGWVPVSAVSPSILVAQIEIEKRERSQEKLPILDPPIAGEGDREGSEEEEESR